MSIRHVQTQDMPALASLFRDAFPEEEQESIVALVTALAARPYKEVTLALASEAKNTITGYVAFSPLALATDAAWRGSILSPLAVSPGFQAQGFGAALVESGIEQLKADGVDWVFVYGDPAYYGRFGFDAAAAEPFAAPHPLEHPFGWQALPLKKRLSTSGGQVSCIGPLDKPVLW